MLKISVCKGPDNAFDTLRPDYPDTESSLTLDVMPVVGLSTAQLAALEKQLRLRIAELVGREMVFEMAQTAQDFLRKYNVDPKKSIHDEMVEQQQRQQLKLEIASRENAKHEREEERKLKEEEKAKMKVELHEERQRRKQLYRMRGKTPRKKNIISEDLWGSSEDGSSEDDEGDEDDEEMGGSKTPACTNEPSNAFKSVRSAGRPGHAGEQVGSGDASPATQTTPGGAGQMRWKRLERMEYTAEGTVVMSPELLGKGRFGSVYMAMCESNVPGKNPRAGAFFAVKEMRLRAGDMRQGQIEKMMAEVQVQRKVDHPNIVKVFGCDIDTGIFRIFLEYVPLGSVANMLRVMTKLEEEVVRLFTRHLLCGVACLHTNGIVHRDIKPGNLLLGVNGVLKVADFGEAKWLPALLQNANGPESMLTSMHGTTRYMAPEVIRRNYTFAADVWSIGCTVLEMLTGVMPFSSLSNDFAVIRSVTRDGAPPIPTDANLTELCQNFLKRCLANDVNKRASATDLLLDPFVCQLLPDSSNPENSVSVPLDGTIQPRVLVKYQHPLLPLATLAGAPQHLQLPPGANYLPARTDLLDGYSGGGSADGGLGSPTALQREASALTPASARGVTSASRYRQEFEELHILGEGGFGAVFLCRNRLDGQCYAIKKIRLDPDNDLLNKKMLREVKTLSGLHHQSVVRYFQAWIEGGRTSELGAGEDKSESDESSADSHGSDLLEDSIFNAAFVSKVNSKSSHMTGSPDCFSMDNSGGQADRSDGSETWCVPEPKTQTQAQTHAGFEAGMVSMVSLGASQKTNCAAKPLRSIHDEMMQETSVRKMGEEGNKRIDKLTTASSWSDDSYMMTEDEEEEGSGSQVGSVERLQTSGGTADRIISRFANMFDQLDEEGPNREQIKRSARKEVDEDAVHGSGSGDGGDGGDGGFAKKHHAKATAEMGGNKEQREQQRDRDRQSDAQVQILYIQMEYCEKTLSDVISDEKLFTTPDRLWNLFRQLVAGIAYIHSKGIVHRDLKPKNVFLDFSGDIKIGDLGLARFSSGHRKGDVEDCGDDVMKEPKAATFESDEVSAQVGTYLYLAPEVLHGGGDLDDQSKRDLFALGIVLFEMWSRFDTLMERIMTLQDVRKGQFPDKFAEAQAKAGRSNVMHLIRWLLHTEPAKRPSALQVLDSQLMPRTMLESELKQLLINIQSKPYFHGMLMEALFGRQDRAADLLYDPQSCLARLPGPAVASVSHTLTRIFIRHAAELLEVPLMTPTNACLTHRQQVLLMDPTGTHFCLPYDSSTPFAYYLARKSRVSALRRYSFGRVYRSRAGEMPKEATEASFDIACSKLATLEQRCIEEAEIIRVLLEVLYAFPVEGPDSYIVSVSYKGLVKGITEAVRVPQSHVEDVCIALLHSRKLGRSAGRKKLLHVMNGLDCMEALTNLMNKLWLAQNEGCLAQVKVLQDALAGSPDGMEAVRQLRQVLELACAMLPNQCDRIRIVVDPALSLPRYQDGLVLHASIKTQKKRVERVVAMGGRYDSLVMSQALTPAAAKPSACCRVVGISFSLDLLCSDTRLTWATSPDVTNPNSQVGLGGGGGDSGVSAACLVLVYSRDGVMAEERLCVMGELWDNGIGVQTPDLPQPHSTSPVILTIEQLQTICAQRHLDWILILENERAGERVSSNDNRSNDNRLDPRRSNANAKDLRLKLTRSRDARKGERVKAERLAAAARRKEPTDNLPEYLNDYQAQAEYQASNLSEILDIMLERNTPAAATASNTTATSVRTRDLKKTNSFNVLPERVAAERQADKMRARPTDTSSPSRSFLFATHCHTLQRTATPCST